MKTQIMDGLQVLAALLITGGMIVSAAPLPAKNVTEAPQKAQTAVVTVEPVVEETKAPEPPVVQPEAPTDPNHCEPSQYWAKEPPYSCIPKPTQVASASPVATSQVAATVGGNCSDWKSAAGIPNNYATNALINNESGCRTTAINPSSGACGIPQALPCSKMACPLNDSGAVCQLQWMDNYVKNRYGSWENAYAMWQSRCGSREGCWY